MSTLCSGEDMICIKTGKCIETNLIQVIDWCWKSCLGSLIRKMGKVTWFKIKGLVKR